MQWIEGVQRQHGAWGVMVSTTGDEAPVWMPAAKMGALSLVSGKTSRRRLTTSFSTWRPTSVGAYMNILGHTPRGRWASGLLVCG
jgi:hypothetical protein